MRILIVASAGHVELATSLERRGHAIVLAVAARPAQSLPTPPTRVVEFARTDAWPTHWQKSASPEILRAFRAALIAEAPDVVLVLTWSGLTRDLVHAAALARVPCVVALVDAWTHCPIGTRVRTDTGAACDAVVGVHPCVACASCAVPRTPWVPREAQYMALAERQAAVERELELARVVFAPDARRAEDARRFLGPVAARIPIEIAPLEDVVAIEALLARAVTLGPPSCAAPKDDWYGERMRTFAIEAWDRSLASASSAETGLATP